MTALEQKAYRLRRINRWSYVTLAAFLTAVGAALATMGQSIWLSAAAIVVVALVGTVHGAVATRWWKVYEGRT